MRMVAGFTYVVIIFGFEFMEESACPWASHVLRVDEKWGCR